MSSQAAFAESLLARDGDCPSGLATWNGSAPGKRFAVYRNNVIVSLIDALADNFPVTLDLVGEQFFRAMARQFVHVAPPRSPVLAMYGKGFPEFIESFPPAAGLPYLADVAHLEILRVQAWHAADADPLRPEKLARLVEDSVALPTAVLALHPSLHLLRSRYAVVSLWVAHQSESAALALATVDTMQPETALVLRNGLEVEISGIGGGTTIFVSLLLQGTQLGEAAGQALATDPSFDLVASLALLIRGGGIVGVSFARSACL